MRIFLDVIAGGLLLCGLFLFFAGVVDSGNTGGVVTWEFVAAWRFLCLSVGVGCLNRLEEIATRE